MPEAHFPRMGLVGNPVNAGTGSTLLCYSGVRLCRGDSGKGVVFETHTLFAVCGHGCSDDASGYGWRGFGCGHRWERWSNQVRPAPLQAGGLRSSRWYRGFSGGDCRDRQLSAHPAQCASWQRAKDLLYPHNAAVILPRAAFAGHPSAPVQSPKHPYR